MQVSVFKSSLKLGSCNPLSSTFINDRLLFPGFVICNLLSVHMVASIFNLVHFPSEKTTFERLLYFRFRISVGFKILAVPIPLILLDEGVRNVRDLVFPIQRVSLLVCQSEVKEQTTFYTVPNFVSILFIESHIVDPCHVILLVRPYSYICIFEGFPQIRFINPTFNLSSFNHNFLHFLQIVLIKVVAFLIIIRNFSIFSVARSHFGTDWGLLFSFIHLIIFWESLFLKLVIFESFGAILWSWGIFILLLFTLFWLLLAILVEKSTSLDSTLLTYSGYVLLVPLLDLLLILVFLVEFFRFERFCSLLLPFFDFCFHFKLRFKFGYETILVTFIIFVQVAGVESEVLTYSLVNVVLTAHHRLSNLFVFRLRVRQLWTWLPTLSVFRVLVINIRMTFTVLAGKEFVVLMVADFLVFLILFGLTPL